MNFELDGNERELRNKIEELMNKIKESLAQHCINEKVKGLIEEMGKNAHELHMSLYARGHKPLHHEHMIKNRGVEPENSLFYMNVHPVEDLLKYIKNLENPENATVHLPLSIHAGATPPPLTGVITFLDVLGWKGVYSRKQNAISSLMKLINDVRSKAEKHRGRINGSIEVKSISDTIVIFTPCSKDEISLAIDIHGSLCQWIIPESIYSEIPVRGAISYGELEVKENIFVGKAVDEAAAWHEQADWIGVHLTPSIEYLFDGKTSRERWFEFTPPTKTPLKWKPHCVNWTAGWEDRNLEIERIKMKFCLLGPIVPEIAGKFVNTLEFIEKINQEASKEK